MTTTTKTAADSTEPDRTRRWSAVDAALWCYLFLPVPIFLLGFFVPALGLPLTLLALAGAAHFLSHAKRPAVSLQLPWRALAALALLAAAWVAPGGAGHLFHANGIDWVPRFAVLRDLVVERWPPRYGAGEAAELLRAPLGYYLPPALLARATGLDQADRLLLGWTWLGVFLLFAATFAGSLRQRLALALVFAFASGLDVVGLWLRQGTLPWPTQHIEWWAGGLQYSSNTTLLFWVPNHGLPGWIAAAWLWRFRDNPAFLSRLPALFLPVMLWSPLVAIGLLPLALAVAAGQRKALTRGLLPTKPLATSFGLVALPGALVAAYLLQGMFDGGRGPNALTPTAAVLQQAPRIADWLLFVVLEAAVFCAYLIRRECSPLTLATTATLVLLPWLQLGPNNDLSMRASIPALCILWLAIGETLVAPATGGRRAAAARTGLLLLFALGAVTPLQEFHRAFAGHSWQADTRLSAPQALGGFPPHYFISEGRAWLAPVMRR